MSNSQNPIAVLELGVVRDLAQGPGHRSKDTRAGHDDYANEMKLAPLAELPAFELD